MHPVPQFGGLTAKITPSVKSAAAVRVENGWAHYHYRVQFAFEGRHMTVQFKTGVGWDRLPTPAEVLEAHFGDALGGREADDWEDYASTFGYTWRDDPAEARRVKRTYHGCLMADRQLRQLFGEHFEHAERVFMERGGEPAPIATTMREAMRQATVADTLGRGLWTIDTVLAGFYDVEGEEPEVPAGDLLADLMHWCAEHGVPWEEVLGRAERTYQSDREEWGVRA